MSYLPYLYIYFTRHTYMKYYLATYSLLFTFVHHYDCEVILFTRATISGSLTHLTIQFPNPVHHDVHQHPLTLVLAYTTIIIMILHNQHFNSVLEHYPLVRRTMESVAAERLNKIGENPSMVSNRNDMKVCII